MMYAFYRLLYFPKLGNKPQLLVVGVQSEENLDQLIRLGTQEVYYRQIFISQTGLVYNYFSFFLFLQVLQSNFILKKAIGIW